MEHSVSILEIEQLSCGYGANLILNGLDLIVSPQELCCIIGEVGSGKSTLLKAITQQISSIGKIQFAGQSLKGIPTHDMTKKGIDYIAQGGNILNDFSVYEHICLALSKKENKSIRIVWEEIIEIFPKMKHLKKQPGGMLSGGERIILSMACLLATDAGFIILDEPTSGLSPETTDVIRELLLWLKNERKKTLLVLEHNYDFVFDIADSVAIIKDGCIKKKFYPEEFKNTGFVDINIFDIKN